MLTLLPDPHDAIANKPHCSVCHDAGYVRVDVPVTDERFGKSLPCSGEDNKGCVIHQLNIFNAIKSMTIVPDELAEMEADWTTFPRAMDKSGITKMKSYSGRIISRDLKDLRGALIYGKNQIGKTGLMYCVHQDILAAGLSSIFIDSITFFQRMLSAKFADDPERYNWLMDRFCGVYHLAFDDIGSEKMTDTREETLFTLLNRRTKGNVVTTITSNLAGTQLGEVIGMRSYSRLKGHTFRQIAVKGDVCALTIAPTDDSTAGK